MASEEENIDHAVYIAGLLRRRDEMEMLTSVEQKLIEEWETVYGADPLFRDRKAVVAELRQLNAYDTQDAVKHIYGKLGMAIPSRVRKIGGILKWSVAAAVLLIFAAVKILYFDRSHTNQQPVALKPGHTLQPGGNRATLTLADGRVIELDSTHNGQIAVQGQTDIVKEEGRLTYNKKSPTTAEVLYNSIATPRGGQYALTLADGTKVWLNAASSLRYPTAFAGGARLVELTGEAYFEVTGDKSRPFKVRLNGMDVQVLGTRFDIKGYPGDASIKTTLVDGSVKLSDAAAGEVVLKPGQQGLWSPQQSRFLVRTVNTDMAIAWMKGYFAFDNEPIHDIMKDLARWYNVDVEFRDTAIKKNFGGTISRYQYAEEVLEMLQLTGSVHFKVKDKKIVVMP
ncbi:MAG TPA: FecR domain-containing protein [Puia sp.]|nr:FecR domain-containing protein [Puia sp.]